MSYEKSEKAVYISPTERKIPVPEQFNVNSQNLGNPMYIKKRNSNSGSYENPNFYTSYNPTEPNVYEGIPYFEKGKQGETHGNYDYARNSEIPLGVNDYMSSNDFKNKQQSKSDLVPPTTGYAPLMNATEGDYTTLSENISQDTYAELGNEDTYTSLGIVEEDSYATLHNSANPTNRSPEFPQSQYVGW